MDIDIDDMYDDECMCMNCRHYDSKERWCIKRDESKATYNSCEDWEDFDEGQ